MATSNGAEPRPLRFVVFGESIVSDWENPPADTWRPILQALAAAGHDATFLEQRRNRPVVELLRARGAGPVRAFGEQYPDILYRTYDLPSGAHRQVWFGREVATADVVIVLDTAPAGVVEELTSYDTPRIVKVFHRTGHGRLATAPDAFDVVLPPSWPESNATDTVDRLISSIRQFRQKRLGMPYP